MPVHLVASISGHGFGHVAQTAPILNLLQRLIPQLRLTIRSTVPEKQLRSRIDAPFNLLQSTGDIGMAMSSALVVDIEKSRAAYRHFHADWQNRVADEAELLSELKADLVFSNVGYLPLAGAQQAGIPNIALCSLNWADIYRHYCGEDRIALQILSCYRGADAFLRATPGMAMNDPSTTGLANLRSVAPIAAVGNNLRSEINRHLKLSKNEKLVLVSMGGIASRLPVENWPRLDGVRYLVPTGWQVEHPDAIAFESIPVGFSDLLSSCDALLFKPGYGSFVEAACSGVPVLYVNRPDWPESPALTTWLKSSSVCREIAQLAMERGEFAAELEEIWNAAKPTPVVPSGVPQVADYLAEKLN